MLFVVAIITVKRLFDDLNRNCNVSLMENSPMSLKKAEDICIIYGLRNSKLCLKSTVRDIFFPLSR